MTRYSGSSKIFVALAFAFGVTAFGAAAAELRIAGPGGAGQAAASASMVKPYAAKAGIKVVEDEYDQKLAEIRAQVEAKSLKWDVVMVGPSIGPLACDEGLLEISRARAS